MSQLWGHVCKASAGASCQGPVLAGEDGQQLGLQAAVSAHRGLLEGQQPGSTMGQCPELLAALPRVSMEDGQDLCLLLQKRNLPPENKTFCVQMQLPGRFVFKQGTLNQRAGAGFILR